MAGGVEQQSRHQRVEREREVGGCTKEIGRKRRMRRCDEERGGGGERLQLCRVEGSVGRQTAGVELWMDNGQVEVESWGRLEEKGKRLW